MAGTGVNRAEREGAFDQVKLDEGDLDRFHGSEFVSVPSPSTCRRVGFQIATNAPRAATTLAATAEPAASAVLKD